MLKLDNLGFPHPSGDDDDYDDEDMVKKKEALLQSSQMKKAVETAVENCLGQYGISNEDLVKGRFSEAQRLHRNELKLDEIEKQVDDLAADSLKLSRRVASLNRKITSINKDITTLQTDIKVFKGKTSTATEVAEQYETKHDKAWEEKRDTYLRIAVIVVSVIAVVISAFSYFKGGN